MNKDEIMKKQPTINIGTIGHVAHGKSTLVNAISSIKTVKFKQELEKNITIRLGYANTKIYKCDFEKCPRPKCYQSFKSTAKPNLSCKREGCTGKLILVKHISFVDCPGHDVLMTTMINGTAVMDAAILMIAANEPCPQPQTKEHLFALEKTDLSKIIVLQNKIDLISRERCLEQYDRIKEFLANTKAKDSPIIPVSGQYKLNIEAVLDYIVNYIPDSTRSISEYPKMVIIRSFDVNLPGCEENNLKGGIIGGSILHGMLKLGDEIEVRPGFTEKTEDGIKCFPYISKIVSLKTENEQLDEAYPGGLIAIGTNIDPSTCIADNLVGQTLGLKGHLPDIFYKIQVNFNPIDGSVQSKQLINTDNYILNIGSSAINSTMILENDDLYTFLLQDPVCCDLNDKVAISKRIGKGFRLIGYGEIFDGERIEPLYEEIAFNFEELKEELNKCQ